MQVAQVLRAPRTWPEYAGTAPDGSRPSVWVAVGSEAWGWARGRVGRYLVALLPPDDDPTHYDWRPVIPPAPPLLLVAAGAVDGHQVEALVRELLMAGAGRVLFIGPNGSILYRPPEPGDRDE